MKAQIERFMADMGIDDYGDILSLYEDYITECDALLVELCLLNTPKSQDSWTQYQKIVHNIKGVSANLYVGSVHESAEALDTYLKDMNPTTCDPTFFAELAETLQETFRGAQVAIQTFFKQEG